MAVALRPAAISLAGPLPHRAAWSPAQGPYRHGTARGTHWQGRVSQQPLAACAVAAAGVLRRRRRHQVHSVQKASHTVRHAGQRAVIFDCDGVISESEELHRQAYNQVFDEFGLGVTWSEEYYDVLQNSVGGGKPKMRHHFGQYGWPASKLGPAPAVDDAEAQTALVDALQARKTEIYLDMVASGRSVPRPGILDLLDECLSCEGLRVAVCSAGTKEGVTKVLQTVLGSERLARFDLLLLGDDVPKKKPDPLIYNTAAERLGADPADCVVVEDSRIGLQAALGAGMPCYITYTASTCSQDFAGAREVVCDATQLSLERMLGGV